MGCPSCAAHALTKKAPRLVHNEGHEVSGDDISAEVLVRGPTVMQGYLGNTSANTDAFDQDGWLRTGDIAYQIGGKFYIVDRKKVSM